MSFGKPRRGIAKGKGDEEIERPSVEENEPCIKRFII